MSFYSNFRFYYVFFTIPFSIFFENKGQSAQLDISPTYIWTIDDVVKMALEHNPDIHIAQANFEASASRVGQSVAKYLPSVDVHAQAQRTTLPSPSAGITDQLGNNHPYSFVGTSIKQTLFDFGKVLKEIQSTESLKLASEQEKLAIQNTIILGVKSAFYNVKSSEQLEEVAKKSLLQVQEIHRRAEFLVKTGVKPRFDLTQADVELSRAKLGLIEATNAKDLAKTALLEAIGVQSELNFELKESDKEFPLINISSLNLEVLREKAINLRPEMQKSDFIVKAATNEMEKEYRDYLPTFSAFASYDNYQPDYPSIYKDSWAVGIQATWNIFDGFSTTSRVYEKQADLSQKRAYKDKEKIHIFSEVTQAYTNLIRTEENIKVVTEGYNEAVENLRLASERYKTNVSTFLELVVAQTALTDAQAAQVQAKYAYYVTVAELQKAVNSQSTNLQ